MRRLPKMGAVVLSCIVMAFASAADVSADAGSTLVVIRGFYEPPESMQCDTTIVIEGQSHGEFVEVRIEGTVYDFSLVTLTWDDETGGLTADKTLHSFPELADATVVLTTYLPEGMPMEKLTWRGDSGDEYAYLLAEDVRYDTNILREFIVD